MKDIIIEYQLDNDVCWKRNALSPQEYFDQDESGYSIDSIQKFYLEPRDYVSAEQSKIVFLNFYVNDNEGNSIVTKFTYWGKGMNQIKDHCNYKNGNLVYRTIINGIQLVGNDALILRLEEIKGQLVPITHVITDMNEDCIQENDLTVFKNFRNSS